jgi:hypothetical protein
MPKSTLPNLPLQGIFALAKPSGPTTMSLLTRLKPLFSSSRLFMEPDKLQAMTPSASDKMKRAYPGPTLPGELTGKDRGKDKRKGKGGKTNWKKVSKQYLKMGSGGTLDPLADGVLSTYDTLIQSHLFHLLSPLVSYWGGVWNEGSGSVSSLYKGKSCQPEILCYFYI